MSTFDLNFDNMNSLIFIFVQFFFTVVQRRSIRRRWLACTGYVATSQPKLVEWAAAQESHRVGRCCTRLATDWPQLNLRVWPSRRTDGASVPSVSPARAVQTMRSVKMCSPNRAPEPSSRADPDVRSASPPSRDAWRCKCLAAACLV